MKQYIAAKPCNFGGRRYNIGEAIEAGTVDPNRAPTLIKYGIIQEADDKAAPQAKAPTNTPVEQPDAAKAKKQTGRKKVE